MKPQLIRVIITDDHRMFADGVKMLLADEDHINVVGIAANGKELLELLEQEPADVVLLDISMPKMNGIDALNAIHKKFPKVRVLVVTMHNTEDKILQLVESGVHGYLLKNADRGELIHAIQQLAADKKYFSPDIVEKMMAAHKRGRSFELLISNREKEVLELVYRGFSTTEIADKLFISPHTVETHRKNLLSKTETHSTTQLIHYAISKGLIQPEERD